MLLIAEKIVFGSVILGIGIIGLLITIYQYAKKKNSDCAPDCGHLAYLPDCGHHHKDCDVLDCDCDGGPDCDCTP